MASRIVVPVINRPCRLISKTWVLGQPDCSGLWIEPPVSMASISNRSARMVLSVTFDRVDRKILSFLFCDSDGYVDNFSRILASNF